MNTIKTSAKTTRELLDNFGHDRREIVMGFIQEAKAAGTVSINWRDNGEPEYKAI
jgi:hypothetical protein